LGRDHDNVGAALNNLAGLYDLEGRYSEAQPLYVRALANTEKALGPDHPDVGIRLNNLAGMYVNQGRYDEAEPLFKRALAITEKALGADHPNVGLNLAVLYFLQNDWVRATGYWRASMSVVIRRAQRGTLVVGQPQAGNGKSEAEQ
jgi:tetratricopeptide (TPR) repeat protein